ncbi:unnamed protein product [Adineta ricciae]|uniref:Microtubule-associated protein 1A/B/S-like MBL-like domain-containing protein n=1 Tax=Adineta ricciae TaxID=249248 RepID=A0A815X946_ADIRI|nr:unnamed protein product [Adineta ricciae]
MATLVQNDSEQRQSAVGLLFIFGDLISNPQRDEVVVYLKRALKQINSIKLSQIEDVFNNLISNDDFQGDSQYRQIVNSESGSIAGFLYLPNFHTVINVLKDYFNSCSHVSLIFSGQQLDSNGGLILADSVFTSDHLQNLLEENSTFVVQDMQIFLPYVSSSWTRLLKQKRIKNVQIDDLSRENNEEKIFGERFYERLVQVLTKDTTNFDIYSKLRPRDSSGTIAFDEPNLYILYGQQGEASLFGIRGFVVLVNGGFSRMPSYWNLLRGLQNVDACVLTHFDYDVLPGLQTILHRKTLTTLHDGRICKPDFGAIFLNHVQRAKVQSVNSSKSSSNSKLLVNISHNIDQVLNDIKQLNIDTYDLVKHTVPNKPSIEPINLYKKIAFGSLDLYVLYPTSSATEDDKALANLQKIPIRDQQPSPALIPLHHWYSSCTLLVWTPTSKSSKDTLVRILYTGVCPQTLVFEALARGRHLEFLHESQITRISGNAKPTGSTNTSASSKHVIQKPKPTSVVPNGEPAKNPLRPATTKPKPTTAAAGKLDKPRSAPTTTTTGRKSTIPTTGRTTQVNNKEKKAQNSTESTTKTNPLEQKSEDQQNEEQKPVDDDNLAQHRPESLSFTNDINETFVESNSATPMDESVTHLITTDPMTTSFVDGAPNTRNPFLEQNENVEIIHHSMSGSTKIPMPSIEEINPQNLPIDDENQSKKVVAKKPIAPTSSTAAHSRKSKQNQLSGPIFYVDVAYIPNHGNEHYVDSEFFRRIRARYYVLNAVEISRLTLESLIEGKQQWDKQEQTPVTLVPTFDSDQLRQFFVMNKVRLAELNINILPASTRCNVQYDDEGSPAQRLRFSQE